MQDNLSQRIVDFIAAMPHCQHDNRDARLGARRLTDGSLILAPDDEEECEQGIVVVDWQGDPARRTKVDGEQLAALEIEEGIRHWVANGTMSNFRTEYAAMADHFQFKTGGNIECGIDRQQDQWNELGRLVRKVGTKAALMALGKAL